MRLVLCYSFFAFLTLANSSPLFVWGWMGSVYRTPHPLAFQRRFCVYVSQRGLKLTYSKGPPVHNKICTPMCVGSLNSPATCRKRTLVLSTYNVHVQKGGSLSVTFLFVLVTSKNTSILNLNNTKTNEYFVKQKIIIITLMHVIDYLNLLQYWDRACLLGRSTLISWNLAY
jgi:hypothetical protein